MSTALPPIHAPSRNGSTMGRPGASPAVSGRLSRMGGPGGRRGSFQDRDEDAYHSEALQHQKRMFSPFHTLKLDGDLHPSMGAGRASAEGRLLHRITLDVRPGCRETISQSIEARVSKTAAVEGKAFGAGRYDEMGTRHGAKAWEKAYSAKCQVEAEKRKHVRDSAKHAIKNYKPVVFDFSWTVCKPVAVGPTEVAPEKWKEIWNRNLLCSVCNCAATPGVGRLECHTCPVVQHASCTYEFEEDVPDQWLCEECVVQLKLTVEENEEKRQMQQLRVAQLSSALVLQRAIRMYIQYRYYKRLSRVLKSLQGHTRGFLSRIRFHRTFTKAPFYWPFRVRIVSTSINAEDHESCHDGKAAEAMAVVTVLKNEKNDDMKQQLYRFETSLEKLSPSQGGESVTAKWGETVLVPVSVASVTTCVTITTCAKNQNEQEQGTSEFVGQALLDVTDVLLRRRHTKATVPLGPFKYEVKERNGARILNQWRQTKGSVTLEILPSSHVTSQCGFLDEVTVTSNRVSPKRKWFVILLDNTLMMQHRPYDTKPKISFSLTKASVKLNNTVIGAPGVIEVRTNLGSGMHAFTCPDVHERNRWFSKMRACTEKAGKSSKNLNEILGHLSKSTTSTDLHSLGHTHHHDGEESKQAEAR